jgi:hypothetical protein
VSRRPLAFLLLVLAALAAGAGPHPCAAPEAPPAEAPGDCHGAAGSPSSAGAAAGDASGDGDCCAAHAAGACASACGMPSLLAAAARGWDPTADRLPPSASAGQPRGSGAPRDHVPLA